MKTINTIIIATVLAFVFGFLGQMVNASEMARVVKVQTNYETIAEFVPRQTCRQMEVPIYQKKSGDAGNVLLGMILGGVSGKVITGDDGGAAVGAVIGGLIGADGNNKVVGYRQETVCETIEVAVQKRVVQNFTITYRWENLFGQSITWKRFNIGDEVPIDVRIQTKPNFEIRG